MAEISCRFLAMEPNGICKVIKLFAFVCNLNDYVFELVVMVTHDTTTIVFNSKSQRASNK